MAALTQIAVNCVDCVCLSFRFPGTVNAKVVYAIPADAMDLSITMTATTDKDTPINIINHNYFNLKGSGNGDILDHIVEVSRQAPTNSSMHLHWIVVLLSVGCLLLGRLASLWGCIKKTSTRVGCGVVHCQPSSEHMPNTLAQLYCAGAAPVP